MKKVMLVGFMVLFSSCASIEERCLKESQIADASMKEAYFNSCVTSHRQQADQWANAFKPSHSRVTCTPTFGGAVDCTQR